MSQTAFENEVEPEVVVPEHVGKFKSLFPEVKITGKYLHHMQNGHMN